MGWRESQRTLLCDVLQAEHYGADLPRIAFVKIANLISRANNVEGDLLTRCTED